MRTCVCVCTGGFHTLIFHFLVLTQRKRSIKKSQEKKKKKKSLLFYREIIRKCPKSQKGTCPAEIRAPLLQRDKGLCPEEFISFKGSLKWPEFSVSFFLEHSGAIKHN